MDTNVVAAWATVMSVVVAGIAVIFTRKQNLNTELQLQSMQLQNRNMELQTKMMQTQINLSLYKKRFDIYVSLIILLESVLYVSLPKDIADTQRFIEEITKALQVYWKNSREKMFLIDDDLNEYINSVEDKIRNYVQTVTVNLPPDLGPEYGPWFAKNTSQKNEFLRILDEVPKKFKKCLDFKEI